MKKKILYAVLALFTTSIYAQNEEEKPKKTFDIYGHVMTDWGYNFRSIDGNWYDVVRPTKLPSFDGQFAPNGKTYMSVRQTRFGAKSSIPTKLGEFKTLFEFELFGTAVDVGQTTIRLRHAYGELGKFGVGQYWSPFMDIDVFPNSLEYWGPSGMVFFRNIQVRYMPIKEDKQKLTIALERPGASPDESIYADRIQVQDIRAKFDLPDLSAEYRYGFSKGYVELAGILRHIEWVDTKLDSANLSGSATGWGLNLSTNINILSNTVFRGQFVYGEGIQNYMNDATADIGVVAQPNNPGKPFIGKAMPVGGLVAFVDHRWSPKFSSAIGYSVLNMTLTSGSRDDSFRRGEYGLVNLIYYPVDNILFGTELQWGQRTNFRDGYKSDIYKLQFSFKYNFGIKLQQ